MNAQYMAVEINIASLLEESTADVCHQSNGSVISDDNGSFSVLVFGLVHTKAVVCRDDDFAVGDFDALLSYLRRYGVSHRLL